MELSGACGCSLSPRCACLHRCPRLKLVQNISCVLRFSLRPHWNGCSSELFTVCLPAVGVCSPGCVLCVVPSAWCHSLPPEGALLGVLGHPGAELINPTLLMAVLQYSMEQEPAACSLACDLQLKCLRYLC